MILHQKWKENIWQCFPCYHWCQHQGQGQRIYSKPCPFSILPFFLTTISQIQNPKTLWAHSLSFLSYSCTRPGVKVTHVCVCVLFMCLLYTHTVWVQCVYVCWSGVQILWGGEGLMWCSKVSSPPRKTIKHEWQEQMALFIVPWNANTDYLCLVGGIIIYLFLPPVPLPANSTGGWHPPTFKTKRPDKGLEPDAYYWLLKI